MSRVSALTRTKEKIVGTETDRYGVLHSSFLAYEEEDGLKTFGYYRSKEGREFLRRLYPFYLRRVEFGDGKVATIIADTHANPKEEEREVSRTKQALRRWRQDGQAELWPKDSQRNARQLRRLENEYLSIIELSEVLGDRAETIQKIQSGHALARFFYGSLPFGKTNNEIAYLHAVWNGIYKVEKLTALRASDKLAVIQRNIISTLVQDFEETGQVPNSIDLVPFGIDRDSLENRDRTILISGRQNEDTHLRLSTVKGMNFMIAQEFDLKSDGEALRARNFSTGYAFPMPDGTFHILFTKHGPKHKREYVALTPDETAFPEGKYPEKGKDFGWSANRRPFSDVWQLNSDRDERETWFRLKPEGSSLDRAVVDNCEKHLESVKWNLIP